MEGAATRHFTLATAGHVDHGKSALVRALTGTDPDRLPEEKDRGITIDLGFAHLLLHSPDGTKHSIGIVDVPGHEDFIKNMVAGVGSIDAALLVVAADDGWMPQTEEHLQILTYLGIRAGVVALTKADLIEDVTSVTAEIRTALSNTPLANAPIVPTSTITGRGIDHLKSEIASMFMKVPAPRDMGKPRLPIDRAFSLKGVGTVVTGTLTGGTLTRGQHIAIQPAGDKKTRIRSMQHHGRDVDRACPGSRVAVNLPDVQPAEAARGRVLTLPDAFRPSRRLAVLLTRTGRCSQSSRPASLKNHATVYFHHATASSVARVRLHESDALTPGQCALAILTLHTPMLVFGGDRFILRDASQQATLAGGVVLDPHAPSLGPKRQDYRAALLRLAEHPADATAHIAALIAKSQVVGSQDLLAQSTFNATEIHAGIEKAIQQSVCVAADDLLVGSPLWKILRTGILDAIHRHHQEHSEQSGLPRTQLRPLLTQIARKQIPGKLLPSLEQALLDDLQHAPDRVLCVNGIVQLQSHRPALPPALRQAGEQLHKILTRHPFDPPSRKELAPNDLAQQALQFMIATGAAIRLSNDVVLSAAAYSHAIEQIRAHLSAHGPATVSQLKNLLNSSRRIMVPLLERLDQDGITRREGDLRCLAEQHRLNQPYPQRAAALK